MAIDGLQRALAAQAVLEAAQKMCAKAKRELHPAGKPGHVMGHDVNGSTWLAGDVGLVVGQVKGWVTISHKNGFRADMPALASVLKKRVVSKVPARILKQFPDVYTLKEY